MMVPENFEKCFAVWISFLNVLNVEFFCAILEIDAFMFADI